MSARLPILLAMLSALAGLPAQPARAIDGGQTALLTTRSAEQQQKLDELFDQLGRETSPKAAKRTSRLIFMRMTDSGSDTIDLLMERAAEAMGNDDSAVALDLLDQVIALAPDYAEGWNRRATLYFTMKRFGRSISDVEQVLTLEPRHFGALSGLAVMLQAVDRDREALTVWYRLLEIYPANPQAQKAVIDLEEKLAGSAT
ncbi:MAG: hypothetical protein KDJ80_04685 [Nitratireductor sp.]|nr:hypothetical protein [Nitratireductor sp.]